MALKNFLSVHDALTLTGSSSLRDAVNQLVGHALAYKAAPLKDKNIGAEKRLGCLFLNPSMRTRISTQVAAQNLGMEAIVFNIGNEGWSLEFAEGAVMNGTSVEHIKDAAPVLGSYFDIIALRTFPSLKDKETDYADFFLQQFVKYCGVPVVSLESATLHPLQSLADVITITETVEEIRLNRRPKVVLTWAPHIKPLPQCVANSFSQWMTAWDEVDFTITHPPGYQLSEVFTEGATILHNQEEALAGADYLYVKNWSAFEDYGAMLYTDENWMLTNEHLKLTNKARVMHCLPVRRNVELSDEILDGTNSLITRQAGNRVWAAQSVLSSILNG